jgi:hypothetical protein
MRDIELVTLWINNSIHFKIMTLLTLPKEYKLTKIDLNLLIIILMTETLLK